MNLSCASRIRLSFWEVSILSKDKPLMVLPAVPKRFPQRPFIPNVLQLPTASQVTLVSLFSRQVLDNKILSHTKIY